MIQLEYLDEQAPGVAEYEEVFGEYELDGLPYQFDIDNRGERPSFFCMQFGKMLKRCVDENRKVTVRDYVDAFYLKNGVYSHLGVTSRDFDSFVDEISKMEVYF